MEPITIIDGVELRDLITDLSNMWMYRLRIHQAADGSGVKIKVNEGTWTYWIGRADQ